MDNIKLDLIRNASSHRATIQDSIYLLGPIISITSTVLGKLKYEQWSVTAINNKESKVKKTFRKSTVSVYNRFGIEEKRQRQQQTVKKKLNLEEPNSIQPPPTKKKEKEKQRFQLLILGILRLSISTHYRVHRQ